MKDLEFKKLCKDITGIKNSNLFNADYEFEFDGLRLVIEYENSSRGLVHNYVKILKKYEELSKDSDILVLSIFISTKHHSKNHKADVERFKFISTKTNSEMACLYFDDEDNFFGFLRGVIAGEHKKGKDFRPSP